MAETDIPFGRFTLKNILGKGSFGIVYRAFDSQRNQDVAIKLLHQGLTADASFVEKARNEANLVQQIQHRNVVKILEVGDADGRYYIEMELIEGQALSDILKTGTRLNVEQSVTLIEQVAAALEATHAKKIIHRDVKPANILIDKSGNAHLVDFGLAHAAKSSLGASSTSAGLGTAIYMSPEQANGRRGDNATDVYSLGIVAYELFTGRPPFQADSLPGFMKAHLDQKPPEPQKLNPGITPAIQAVLYKVLSKEPSKRYRSTTEFARALRKASEKPEANSGRQIGCMMSGLALIALCAVTTWALFFGPFKDLPQKLISSINAQPTKTTLIPIAPSGETPKQTNLPPVTDQNVVFFDGFDNGFDLRWQKTAEQWVVSNGVPVLLKDHGCGLVTIGDPSWDNFALDVDMVNPRDGRDLYNGWKIIVAYQSPGLDAGIEGIYNNIYYGFYRFLLPLKQSSWTEIPQSRRELPALKPTESLYHFHLEVRGDNLRLWINNQLQYNYTQIGQSLTGGVGLYTCAYEQNFVFDNFALSNLP